jgi:diketogulonate reductase-like aldo/keto reductase
MMKVINTKIKLNNGVEMPQVGYGSYKVTDPITGYEAIKTAINDGYLMIDTAELYGNQTLIAKAIKDSNKKREDLFITSKI